MGAEYSTPGCGGKDPAQLDLRRHCLYNAGTGFSVTPSLGVS
jgi:hypothetical protein